MPFGLRNAGVTYQRMMNKVYDKNLLGDILEVYMDDMIDKSQQEVDHAAHLKRVFEHLRKEELRRIRINVTHLRNSLHLTLKNASKH